MNIWITQDGEPLPAVDDSSRYWRCGILARELVKRGHQVVWWASTFDHARKQFWFERACAMEPIPGMKLRLLHGPGYYNNRSFRRIRHQRKLGAEFTKGSRGECQPDLIFSSLPTLELAQQALTYGINGGVPVIVDVRDLWPDHYLTLVPRVLRGVFRLLLFTEFKKARFILKSASGITAISRAFLDWGLNYAARGASSKDGVFEMGYPSTDFIGRHPQVDEKCLGAHYGIEADAMNITFVGSVNSIFDFSTVIRAARHFSISNSRIKFVIVGDGTNFHQVRSAAKPLSNVTVTGRLDKESVSAILNLSSIGLSPHKEGRSINGALPNKSFEYMAAGLPMLSSLRGELENLLCMEKIGRQYLAGSVDSLIKQIHWFAEHPIERKDMGLKSKELFRKKFCAEVIYPKLVNHLEGVAVDRAGR